MKTILIVTLAIVASLGISEASVIYRARRNETRSYVVRAQHLADQDKLGYSDPYLVVKNMDTGSEIYRSKTSRNVLNPVFTPVLKLQDNHWDTYYFEIRDEDSMNPDDSLGSVAIRAYDLVGTHALSSGAQLIISLA